MPRSPLNTHLDALVGDFKKAYSRRLRTDAARFNFWSNKLSSEGLISAYSHIFGMRSWIFRFANVIGSRATHGILVDFIRKLREDPRQLEVLGDGKQRKSYLLVQDCVDAMLFAFKHSNETVNIFNLGTDDDIRVSEIAKILIRKSGLRNVRIKYTGGSRGWRGDVPLMLLDTGKIKKLGWKVRYGSREAVERAIEDLLL